MLGVGLCWIMLILAALFWLFLIFWDIMGLDITWLQWSAVSSSWMFSIPYSFEDVRRHIWQYLESFEDIWGVISCLFNPTILTIPHISPHVVISLLLFVLYPSKSQLLTFLDQWGWKPTISASAMSRSNQISGLAVSVWSCMPKLCSRKASGWGLQEHGSRTLRTLLWRLMMSLMRQ